MTRFIRNVAAAQAIEAARREAEAAAQAAQEVAAAAAQAAQEAAAAAKALREVALQPPPSLVIPLRDPLCPSPPSLVRSHNLNLKRLEAEQMATALIESLNIQGVVHGKIGYSPVYGGNQSRDAWYNRQLERVHGNPGLLGKNDGRPTM